MEKPEKLQNSIMILFTLIKSSSDSLNVHKSSTYAKLQLFSGFYITFPIVGYKG